MPEQTTKELLAQEASSLIRRLLQERNLSVTRKSLAIVAPQLNTNTRALIQVLYGKKDLRFISEERIRSILLELKILLQTENPIAPHKEATAQIEDIEIVRVEYRHSDIAIYSNKLKKRIADEMLKLKDKDILVRLIHLPE